MGLVSSHAAPRAVNAAAAATAAQCDAGPVWWGALKLWRCCRAVNWLLRGCLGCPSRGACVGAADSVIHEN
jgi:hypothetical protein